MSSSDNNIILGEGVFAINGVDVAFTRGGGEFTVEENQKDIAADGYFGSVQGLKRITRSVPKLTMKVLELKPDMLTKIYPAKTIAYDGSKYTLKGTVQIADSDYVASVTWTGRDQRGRPVVITVENAINIEPFKWTMVDKEEVVASITFEGTYTLGQRTTPPWKVEWFDAATGDLAPPNATIAAPTAGLGQKQIVLEFSEKLNATTYAITDRNALILTLVNDAAGTATPISVSASAGSVVWTNTGTNNPIAIVTIPSTDFVVGQRLKLNFKDLVVKDTYGNGVLAISDFMATVV